MFKTPILPPTAAQFIAFRLREYQASTDMLNQEEEMDTKEEIQKQYIRRLLTGTSFSDMGAAVEIDYRAFMAASVVATPQAVTSAVQHYLDHVYPGQGKKPTFNTVAVANEVAKQLRDDPVHQPRVIENPFPTESYEFWGVNDGVNNAQWT